MGLSRNKVAVPEGAAGSPPFYGVFFSGRRSGVRRAAHASGTVPGFAWACWCGRDRWLRGFLLWVRGVVWVCFWVPGPPPATWSRAVFRVSPWGGRPAGVPCPDRFLGAWWFENWIVDASNAGLLSCLLYRDFARLFFLESGFEIDRFVIIVYSVMICRLA